MTVRHIRQRGVALLTALLTVTLVATFAAAALWQQWRAAELEAAERTRMQSAWVLVSALDWSRLILREDGRAGGADHLAEPWAVPLEEARLSSFLAADKNIASDALEGLPDAFLSGRIVDAQSKLNVMNLVSGNKPVPSAVTAFTRLFGLLGLPAQEVPLLASNLQRAVAGTSAANPAAAAAATAGGAAAAATAATAASATPAAGTGAPSAGDDGLESGGNAPLLPQQERQLVWLGLSASTVQALEPYVTILPVATAVNINTASAQVLSASVPSLDLAGAQRLVAQRQQRFFASLEDAKKLLPEGNAQFTTGQQGVSTNYFEVHGRLRLDKTWVDETSLLRRDGSLLKVVWRERGAGAMTQPVNR